MPAARRRPPIVRRFALAALVSLLLLEGLVRGVLFHGWFEGMEAFDAMRQPASYSSPLEDEYWQLRLRLGRAPSIESERLDRELGWVPTGVKPGVYDHADGARLEGRRPVLLFGDSFAAGLTPKRALFQSQLERSPVADRLAMLNYGCPGHGLDQALLMMRRALDLWGDSDPVVLVGILMDEGFDRSRLEVRTLPKPRFAARDGALVLERDAVPPLDEYVEAAFPWWKCWAWRRLVYGGVLPESLAARLQGRARDLRDRRLVARLLIETIVAELEERDLVFGFVLFHPLHWVHDPDKLGWGEALTVETLGRLGVPYVLTRESLTADMAASGQPAERYYYSSGMQLNHLNRLGNQVVFEGMLPLIEALEAARAARQR